MRKVSPIRLQIPRRGGSRSEALGLRSFAALTTAHHHQPTYYTDLATFIHVISALMSPILANRCERKRSAEQRGRRMPHEPLSEAGTGSVPKTGLNQHGSYLAEPAVRLSRSVQRFPPGLRRAGHLTSYQAEPRSALNVCAAVDSATGTLGPPVG